MNMVSGRTMQLTKQVGEYLVCAELCRLGFIATTFTGNVPEFDILAINEKHKTIPIQVKTTTGVDWIFDAKKFLNISISQDGRQNIESRKDLRFPKLICIYVKLVSTGKDEFYIFKLKKMQDILLDKYSKMLKKKGGRRPRKPESFHFTVSSDDLKKYRNNWNLLK